MRVKDTVFLSLGDWRAIGGKEEDKPVAKQKVKGLGHRTTRVIHHGGFMKRKF